MVPSRGFGGAVINQKGIEMINGSMHSLPSLGQKYQNMSAQQNPNLQVPTDEFTPINVADLQLGDDSLALQNPLSFMGATSAESAFRANMSEETPAAGDTSPNSTNISDLFAALDTDKDGSISLSELEEGMAKLTGADAEREAVGNDVTDHTPVAAPSDGPDLNGAIAVESLNLEGFMADDMAVGDVDISELTATSSDAAAKDDMTPGAGTPPAAAGSDLAGFDPSAFYESIIAAFSTSATDSIFATSALNRAA